MAGKYAAAMLTCRLAFGLRMLYSEHRQEINEIVGESESARDHGLV